MQKLTFFICTLLIFSCAPRHIAPKLASACSMGDDESPLSKSLCENYMSGSINGFAVAMVTPSGIVYNKGFGYADVQNDQLYTENTLQNIGSISKTFIGIALLKAQEMGKLNLDDPINKYLPFEVVNPHFSNEKILIKHLTTHTSGIKDVLRYALNSYVLTEDRSKETKENINFRSASKMMEMADYFDKLLNKNGEWYRKGNFYKNKPGTKFEYSNIGAALAAYILERATGDTFPDFTQKHIFDVIGMDSAGWSYDDIDINQHSKLYSKSEREIAPYNLVTYPDGGLRTSSADMSKYLLELMRAYKGAGTLLSKSSYQRYFAPQLDDSHFDSRSESEINDEYNFGVFMGMSATGNIGHTGGDPGVTSLLFFNPKTETGFYVIFNTDINKSRMPQIQAILKELKAFEEN